MVASPTLSRASSACSLRDLQSRARGLCSVSSCVAGVFCAQQPRPCGSCRGWQRHRCPCWAGTERVPELRLVFRVQDVVNTHPGLAFLKEASEFHSRYITTVSIRAQLLPPGPRLQAPPHI